MIRAYRFVPGAVYLSLAILCLAPRGASGEVRSLALPRAVEYAMAHNGELKALRAEKEVARTGVVRAGLFPNPTLDLEAGTGTLTGSSDESSVSAGLSQEFLTAGKRAKRLAAAERETEVVHYQIADKERLVALEVKTSFLELLLAHKRLELAKRAIELNGKLLEITRERFAAGDIPELEVNLARVEAARSEGRRIETERGLMPLRAGLLALLGIPVGEECDFGGDLERQPLAVAPAELMRLALGNRPDLKSLEAASARGEAEVEVAEAERFPNVTAGLAYTFERSGLEVGDIEARDRDHLLGLRISITLPVFDRNQAGIREARARKQSAESRLEFARKGVVREVEGDYARLAAAEKAVELYATGILPQLEENLKLVQEAYQLGEVGILSVIEEQKKYIEVHDGYLAALAERQAALARLEASVGKSLE